MNLDTAVQIIYLFSTALFILSLKWMSRPESAGRSVAAGAGAMVLAITGTILYPDIIGYRWIIIALIAGTAFGIPLSRVPLTAVPQRTALSHAFGGLAAGLVGTAKYYLWLTEHELTPFRTSAISVEIILGFITFTGSLMAAGKLQEIIPARPVTYRGQNMVNLSFIIAVLIAAALLVINPDHSGYFPVIICISLLIGILLIIPIGGADMPTVISLLNSYAGLSAVAMGFVLENKLLIAAGALDGSSGLILSIIMSKAMNRSFGNVMFGAFGKIQASAEQAMEKAVKSTTAEEAGQILSTARSVIIVPGYGMAVAQAQHGVNDLYIELIGLGVDVKFAIHPVAGRMPGHMNVLLAEAEIPYDRLIEMDVINPDFSQTDAVLVIGANDVINPAARHDKSSPIFGMPILDADKAKTVIVIKRSMNPGFAGIENELFYRDNTLMLFGDARAMLVELVREISKGK